MEIPFFPIRGRSRGKPATAPAFVTGGQGQPEIKKLSGNGLHYGALGKNCLHVCVDMQRMFAEQTDWHAPWMGRVTPVVRRLVEHRPERTIFTRFIPSEHPGEGQGTWKRYYERWASMTIERLGRQGLELVPELAPFVPPAEIIDKLVYSPWVEDKLQCRLQDRGIDTLVVTGGETDVCVLATVLGAVDRGYRIVVATDGLCSSSDQTHDASLTLYHSRFGQQVETATSEQILSNWTD
jgi:nicotinamidase-related amidase